MNGNKILRGATAVGYVCVAFSILGVEFAAQEKTLVPAAQHQRAEVKFQSEARNLLAAAAFGGALMLIEPAAYLVMRRKRSAQSAALDAG